MYEKYSTRKLMKKFDLLKYLKMLQEFYTLLNFNFIVIYIIHKVSLLLKIILIFLIILLI